MVFKVKMNFCVMIIISCCLGGGFGRLTKVPRNVVALVGTTATLECCNGASQYSLQWRRVSLGTRESSDIYLGKNGGFVDNFGDDRYSISNGNTSGCYNLIISDIQNDDAGTYTCADESDVKQHSASADVTVLETLECYEIYPKDVYMGINEFGLDLDLIQLTCSVEYKGRFVPEMQWKWQKPSKFSNPRFIARNSSSASTSAVTVVAAKEFDKNKVACFVQSPGDEDFSRNVVNWTSKLYRVKYAIFSHKEVANCTAKELNLECNPNCFVSSRDINGSHFCEISFPSEMSLKKLVSQGVRHWTTAQVAIVAVMGILVVALVSVVGILNSRLRLCDVCKRQFLHLEQFRGIFEGKERACYQWKPVQSLSSDAEAAATSDSSNNEPRQLGAPEEKQPLSGPSCTMLHLATRLQDIK